MKPSELMLKGFAMAGGRQCVGEYSEGDPLAATSRATIKGRQMNWFLTNRGDRQVAYMADRHYNRQKIGSPQFVPPGRCVVLKTNPLDAFWVTSWPFAEFVKHAWAGAWVCSAFRNEGNKLSSELIRDAVAATRAFYNETPALGMITFVSTKHVRKKRDWGRCYLKAGFINVGFTKGGLVALQMLPNAMPVATPAHKLQISLIKEAAK